MNERVITFLETHAGRSIGFAKIGATCVGRIGLSFHDFETTGHSEPRRELSFDESSHFEHGDELGVFNLGSTVVLLLEGESFEFADWLCEGQSVEIGRFLGAWSHQRDVD